MKKIFALATLLTVSLLSVEPAQAKQQVFKACREGDCLTWYLLNQTLLRQNPEPHSDRSSAAPLTNRKLYQVEIEVDSQFYRHKSTPPQTPGKPKFQPPPSRPLVLDHRVYKTVKWVNCSTQEPFIADELEKQPDYLDVLYLNPDRIMPGGGSYFNLYWAVCHNVWETPSKPLFPIEMSQLAQNLGYPKTLTYRSETISRKALLGTSDH